MLDRDTDPAAEAAQIACIKTRHPDYTAADLEYALRRMYLGDALFRAAWPDAPLLEP